MTLDRFRPALTVFLEPFVRVAKSVGVGPNVVSAIAFGFALVAGWLFYAGQEWYLVGAVCVFLSGWLDVVDGALARELGIDSPTGDLFDHVLDRYADIVIIGGLAAGIGSYRLGFLAVTGVLMTSYLGTQAEAVGLPRVYGGVLGRADRLALVGITAFVAPFVPVLGPLSIVGWLLVVFGVVGHFTAVQRFIAAYRGL